MEIIGLGAAAGIIVSAVCMMFYRKGVRDGMVMKKGNAPQASFNGKAAVGDEESAAMMKRYETILSYDPYGAARAGFGGGERV